MTDTVEIEIVKKKRAIPFSALGTGRVFLVNDSDHYMKISPRRALRLSGAFPLASYEFEDKLLVQQLEHRIVITEWV